MNYIKFLQSQLKLGGWHSIEEYYDWVRAQVGEIPRHETYWGIVVEELQALGITWMCNAAPESRVFYTDENILAKIIPFLTYPADYYVASLKIDCDDYSLWAQADVSKIFNLNSVFQTWGYVPEGYHAFSLAKVGDNQYRIWEPNAGFAVAGELFEIGTYGYKPEKWK